MLSRIFIRCASRKAFIPPVNFRYASQTEEEQMEELPRIRYPAIKDDWNRNYGNKQSERRYEKNDSHDRPAKYNSNIFRMKSAWIDNKINNFHDKRKKTSKLLGDIYGDDIPKRDIIRINNDQFNIEPLGEIIYGVYPVLFALKAERRRINYILYKKGSEMRNKKIREILEIAQERNIKLQSLVGVQFRSLFRGDQVHQGICCDATPLSFEELQIEPSNKMIKPDENTNSTDEVNSVEFQTEITSDNHQQKPFQLWLYLDRIQDPMNFGAILRSAYFMGVDKVLTPAENSCQMSGVVSKASSGVAEILPVYQVNDPINLFDKLADEGWHLVSSSSSGQASTTPVTDFQPQGHTLLAVGNEGAGVSHDLEKKCTTILTIKSGQDLDHDACCLNVSVATAIILHSLQLRLNLGR